MEVLFSVLSLEAARMAVLAAKTEDNSLVLLSQGGEDGDDHVVDGNLGADSGDGSAHPSPSASSPSGSQRPKACRTAYKGYRCQDNSCARWHPLAYCQDESCYPRRRPDCLDWHPRRWSKAAQAARTSQTAQGNGGRGGKARPNPNSKPAKNRTNSDRTNSRMRKLESELARTKAELSSQKAVGETLKDAIVASQVPSRSTDPVPSFARATTPAMETPVPPTAASVSAPVLPTNLTAILSSLVRALSEAGFTSQ